MKPVVFTIADKANEWMVPYLKNSLRKWHSEEELPFVLYDQTELDKINDEQKFYRATPLFANDLFDKGYDLVIKMDCDSIVMGNLNFILNSDYDVGVVYNWNRSDPLIYGEIGLLTINPKQYYNCGLVAMRDQRFSRNWWKLCDSPHFNAMPFREQGFLNILCHYGDYKVKCFDDYDPLDQHSGWYGLCSKSEWMKIEMIDRKPIVPRAKDDYPSRDKEIHVVHWASGNNEPKMTYRTHFPEEVIDYIDWLIKDTKEPYVR